MYSKPGSHVTMRKLSRNAKAIFIGAMFLFFSILLYLSLCAMPCEYASIDDHLEEEGHSLLVERRRSYHGSKKSHSVFMVVLVVTGPKYFERRTTIRETWMSQKPSDVMLMFALGTAGLTQEELSTVEYENDQNHDLLILKNFNDSYTRLTDKVIESFKWLDRNVDSKFVFKADDDTYARLDILLDELKQKDANRLYWGFFDGRARVKQSGQWAEKKWHLCDTYLPHARGGGYILSSDLVHYIAKNSQYLQRFNSEDISVGAWLGPLDVNRVHDPRFDTEYVSRGCVNEYIVTHKQDPQQMRTKFTNLKDTGKLCIKEYKSRYSYIYNWNVPPSLCCIRNDTKIP